MGMLSRLRRVFEPLSSGKACGMEGTGVWRVLNGVGRESAVATRLQLRVARCRTRGTGEGGMHSLPSRRQRWHVAPRGARAHFSLTWAQLRHACQGRELKLSSSADNGVAMFVRKAKASSAPDRRQTVTGTTLTPVEGQSGQCTKLRNTAGPGSACRPPKKLVERRALIVFNGTLRHGPAQK
jgi:hypothetical protein